ncbi:MAG: CHASE3 domain-containing protein [Bacteroidetes bacterium]|nr:CHASE3 domain-containing protein [Bacteroidota bacterium]MBU1371305.1 CHASE3 domain-containing protein [Bacteroidota bacterium]MBU1485792.1 CHASE3 domain-containing protein [Bacteroidota bacterium]MBU1759232.1 CHASE3 domain-containing protein [Bacteroidota bacterium]MBU2045685.1 CHASE3 domain-containing protein [Bacteroidota bacterium]
MKKATAIYLLLMASCFTLILYGLFYVNAYSGISDNFKISESKYDFLASSGSLIDFLKDAENSQRGYIITGDEKYLESYKNATYRFKQEKTRFNQLINRYDIYKGNEVDFGKIDYLMNKKIAEMDQTILLQKANNNKAAIAFIKSDAGMKMMKEISGLFQKLTINQKFKEVKAKQDIYAYRRQFKILTISTGIFTFISLVIIGILFFLNQKEKRLNKDQTNEDSLVKSIESELKLPMKTPADKSDFIPSV